MTTEVPTNRGYTIIELVLTVSIVALSLSVGIPGFQQMIRDNRLTTQYNQFVAALNTSRSEAIKRGVRVTICKRNLAGNRCNRAGNWEDGWIVFTDPDRDGRVDANETVLRIYEALTVNNTLRPLPATRQRITYNGQGFAPGFASTFKLCDFRGAAKAKGIVISNNGRARRALDRNGDGIVDDGSATGASISCP